MCSERSAGTAALSSIMNASDDEEESGEQTKTTIFIKIAEGKNFPVTDTLSKSSDPYCVLKVGKLLSLDYQYLGTFSISCVE